MIKCIITNPEWVGIVTDTLAILASVFIARWTVKQSYEYNLKQSAYEKRKDVYAESIYLIKKVTLDHSLIEKEQSELKALNAKSYIFGSDAINKKFDFFINSIDCELDVNVPCDNGYTDTDLYGNTVILAMKDELLKVKDLTDDEVERIFFAEEKRMKRMKGGTQ